MGRMRSFSIVLAIFCVILLNGFFVPRSQAIQSYRQPLASKKALSINQKRLVVAHGVTEQSSQDAAQHREVINRAIRTTIITFIATGIFWIGTWYNRGGDAALEFITGFLVEKSLSVDNLFVFLMLFDSFRIPENLQGRVLTWGVIGAILMRGIMIFFGVQALAKFRWILLLFSAILLVSSLHMIQESLSSSHDSHSDDGDSVVMRFIRRFLPTSKNLDGEKFFTVQNGKYLATPLLACLVCVELSDFIFAVDSIPAVLGISKDPYIVFSSNVFAILGLRSLYILLSHAVSNLRYIKPSVAAVLAFVAGKMVSEYFHFEVSSVLSLLVIGILLGAGVLASVVDMQIRSKSCENKK